MAVSIVELHGVSWIPEGSFSASVAGMAADGQCGGYSPLLLLLLPSLGDVGVQKLHFFVSGWHDPEETSERPRPSEKQIP